MDDYDNYAPEEFEETRRDPKVDEAKIALQHFFEHHHAEVFYERQLEIIFERKFFHWITRKALYELHDNRYLSVDTAKLDNAVSIKFYHRKSNRYWRRQANEIAALVRTFSVPAFAKAVGQHGELMFDAALPTVGFMPKGKNIKSYGNKTWTATGHNLDRLFERDAVTYGAEIKNTLPYIPREEMRAKIRMCTFFGIKPLFIVRMAPKSYIEEVRQRGGFTLVFEYQLYPHGHAALAKQVRDRLCLPDDSPTAIEDGTVQRFLKLAQETHNLGRRFRIHRRS